MWVARYSTTRTPFLTYMASRAWRLLPVFVLVDMLTIALLPVLGGTRAAMAGDTPGHALFSNLLILGYSDLRFQPVVPAWSLDIEARYYLLGPLLALAARRGQAGALLVGSAALSLSMALLWRGDPTFAHYLVFFVLGLAAAELDWRPSRRFAAMSGGGSLLILLIVAAVVPGALFGGHAPGPMFRWNEPLNVALALAAAPYAIYTTRQPTDALDRMMADLSYVVYLLHWTGVLWLGTVGGSHLHRLPYIAFAWASVLAASWVIWRWVDRPCNAARARWVAGRTDSLQQAVARETPAP